uniref:Integrin alpha-2 domain-containing protein n=1 Tax=Sphaeramia orbicularis TaxID=375764 RepID=A0A672Y676_9TELE
MFILGVLSALSGVWSFNLYSEHPTVYRGPDGSYFGYSVDFYQANSDSNTFSVLVGAPKANTSQPGIVEAGAVYYCPWPGLPDSCRQIPFDNASEMIKVNGTREPLEFKSHQWFGASVRTHKEKVVACAPLYHWRTVKLSGEKDPVGTCYVAVQNFSAYAEYSPCRTSESHCCCLPASSPFYCLYSFEGMLVVGGPGSFYWQGNSSNSLVFYLYNLLISAIIYLCSFSLTEPSPGVPRTDDVLVGAPLYMERELESKPREVGRVYMYLQLAPLTFSDPVTLTGTYTFGRFGTAIAPLGDINQDGYNDVAVGCPFGGEDRGGRVLIFNGNKDVATQGLTMSQELKAARTPSGSLAGYGFTLRGGQDLDNNQYPDLIVGAFGAGEVSVYRARAVVSVDAKMILTPRILNPEDRQCNLPHTNIMVTCLKVDVCAAVSGVGIPSSVDLRAELQLDWLKGTRGGVKRVLFIDTQQPQRTGLLKLGQDRPHACISYTIYLKEEDEFRDKLTPISLALNYSLAPPTHSKELPPVLNQYSSTFLQEHAYILLDCGDDNICIPNLQLSASIDQSELVIGDENLVMLTITAANLGEGAYETELHTLIPPEADYIGVERRVEVNTHTGLKSVSPLSRVSHPSQVVLPFPRWEPKEKPVKEDDVGPQVTHIYEVTNCTNISCLRVMCVVGRLDRGQSAVVKIRSRLWAHTFLQRRNDPYILNSTVSFMVIAMPYRIRPTTLPQHSTSMGTLVLWGTPDVSFAVPLWVIVLAILLGLLVLAMLTLAMWKVNTVRSCHTPSSTFLNVV